MEPTRTPRWPQPFAGLRGIRWADVPREVSAGITLAALIIPLNIGYAQVAGLPPVVGLYAAIIPLVVFALFTISRHVVGSPDDYKKIDPERLARELEVDQCAVNSGRFWMMDEVDYAGGDTVDFHGVNMNWAGDMTGAEMITQSQSAYVPSLIQRNTIWIWHAGKPLHLLREPGGAVWVLQEYTKAVDDKLVKECWQDSVPQRPWRIPSPARRHPSIGRPLTPHPAEL